MKVEPTWVDGFLFWDAVAVALLVFLDFLIGKQGRKAMKERVGDWWLHLQTTSYTGLVAEDARRVRLQFERSFGKRWFSVRRIVLSVVFSVLLTGLLAFLFLWFLKAVLPSGDHVGDIAFRIMDTPFVIHFLGFVVSLVPINAIFDWISLGVTIYCLRLMERQVKTSHLALLILVDIMAAALLAVLVILLATVGTNFLRGEPFPFTGLGLKAVFAAPLLLIWIAIEVPSMGAAMSGAILTSAVPTLIHLSLAIVFIGSKAIIPVARPVIGLLLLRFYEADKGILTLLALSGGTLAKLIHLGAKYLSSH